MPNVELVNVDFTAIDPHEEEGEGEGEEEDVRGFRSGSCNQPESVWGWTALHAAANRGDQNMITTLLRSSASIYSLSKVIEIVYLSTYLLFYLSKY